MAAKKKAPAKKASKKASKKTSSKTGSTIRCRDWTAVLDTMPPGTPTLTVRGVCSTPTPGYKIKLVEAVPQGKNPLILLLRKVVTPPSGVRPDVIATVEVVFRKKTKTRYTAVTILPEVKTIKVQIVT